MANKIIKTILQNGTKSLLMHIYLESDGVEGELKNYPIIDPLVDYPEGDKGSRNPRPTVRQVWHSFGWFDGLMSFDDLVPAPSWLLQRDSASYSDFRYFGGIKERYTDPDDKNSSDRTGKVLLTTTDFAPLGSTGTMLIEIWKGEA
jgi:hypothetical protein